MVIFLFGINLVRCELTTRGNKTNQMIPLLWSYILTVPVVVGLCFFLRLQSYVYVSFHNPPICFNLFNSNFSSILL